MMRNENKGIAILPVIIWVLLISIVGYAIVKKDRFFQKHDIPIGIVKVKTGDIKARAEDQSHWLPVSVDKKLIDGDRISSTGNSKAEISFGSDRSLVIGEDTVVQLGSIKRGKRNIAFIVELSQGAISAKVGKKCKGCPSIIIKSDDKSFNLLKNRTIGLYKPKNSYVREFKPNGPWPGSANTRNNPLILEKK